MTPPPTTNTFETNVDMVNTRSSYEVFPADKITTADDYNLDELKLEYTNSLDKRGANPTWECWLEHYIDNKNFDQEAFEQDREELRRLIDQDFGADCLNDPSFMYETVADYKNRIDAPLTTLKSILVKDDRACSKSCYYWRDATDKERAEYTNYTPVHSEDDKPITMKQIINTLQKDQHYHKEDVKEQHHNFIEHYEWITPAVMVFHHGS